MAASRNDSYVLGTNAGFLGRVQASMVSAAVAIASEGLNVANHPSRLQLVHQILSSPSDQTRLATMFALSVATDPTVLVDATQAGTVVLGANVGTQQALVTDAHIDAAVSGQFNAYCQGIQA
jgi:hypothetical protein